MLALLIGIAGCASTADISAPAARAGYDDSAPDSVTALLPTTQQPLLESVSRGLLYTSESDYPFVYVRRAGRIPPPTAPLTVAEFRSVFRIAPNTPVQIITLDKFFARHIERADPFDSVAQALLPRYVLLRETLRGSLSHVMVYRVGTIAIDCYAVGFNANGDLEGLQTISIET